MRYSLADKKIRWAVDTKSIMESMETRPTRLLGEPALRPDRRRQDGPGHVEQRHLRRADDPEGVERQDHRSLERAREVPQRSAVVA